MIYADTSFIASVYGPDVNTPAARGFIESHQPCLPISFLHWPELAKAFRTSHPESAENLWDWVQAAGLIINFCPRWKKLRSLDAQHVAAAVEGGFKTFVSFDTRSFQRLLASTQKLKVWPPLTTEEMLHLK